MTGKSTSSCKANTGLDREYNPESNGRSSVRQMSHMRFCRATLTRDADARQSRICIKQRCISKTSRATVRRATTQRATRPVTLATLTRHPWYATKSRDFVAGVKSVLDYTITPHNMAFELLWTNERLVTELTAINYSTNYNYKTS